MFPKRSAQKLELPASHSALVRAKLNLRDGLPKCTLHTALALGEMQEPSVIEVLLLCFAHDVLREHLESFYQGSFIFLRLWVLLQLSRLLQMPPSALGGGGLHNLGSGKLSKYPNQVRQHTAIGGTLSPQSPRWSGPVSRLSVGKTHVPSWRLVVDRAVALDW